MSWTILDTGCKSAEENMEIDASLLDSIGEQSAPILHLYDWIGKSATYGCLTKPEEFLNIHAMQEEGIALAKRPTGGGILFHIWDIAFSVLIPKTSSLFSLDTLKRYASINSAVLQAVKTFLGPSYELDLIPIDFFPLSPPCQKFCMAQPTKYDVLYQGKKIVGAAQRKTKSGLLHQGTISLLRPDVELIKKVLLKEKQEVAYAMGMHTFTLLDKDASEVDYLSARKEIKELLIHYLTKL